MLDSPAGNSTSLGPPWDAELNELLYVPSASVKLISCNPPDATGHSYSSFVNSMSTEVSSSISMKLAVSS